MSGQLGDSTRRRMAAADSAGGGMGGTRSGFNPGASVGGYAGGMGGTFGRSARGLTAGEPAGPTSPRGAARPASAGPGGPRPSPFPYDVPAASGGGWGAGNDTSAAEGKRDRVRPASGAAKSAWHDSSLKTPPRAPPPGTAPATAVRTVQRPQSATKRAGIEPVEYRLQGQGLQAGSPARPMSALQTKGGMSSTSGYGSKPSVSPHPYASTKRSGGVSSPRGTASTVRTVGGGAGGGAAQGGRQVAPQLLAAQRQLEELRADEAEDAALSPTRGEGRPISEALVLALEDAIRDALRLKRSIYEGSKEMLLKLFKEVDDGSGDVSVEEFSAVCEHIGVAVSPVESQALFQRYGYDTVMPYERFAHYLLTQPARQLAEDMPTRKGAFLPGQNANFNGKIIYKPCRKPVYTPSDWDPALVDRSSELPNARLVLDFIYGYQGKSNTAQNLFYTSEQKVVYYTAGVGVVYQRPPVHHQYFFLGHDDDITALAINPAIVDYDNKTYPAKTLVATGQVVSTTGPPYVCIWDSRLGSDSPVMGSDSVSVASEVMRIEFEKGAQGDMGFCALSFSPSGNRLVIVAMNTGHTVYVYDWRKKREVGGGRGHMGDPPQVYGIEWNPYEITHKVPSAFLQFGKKHLRMWTRTEAAVETWTSKALSFGKLQMRHIMSAQWLMPRAGGTECLVAAGTDDGQIYLFKGGTAIRAIAAHRPGPKFIREDGHPGYSGVRGLRVIKEGKVLLSGGADGVIFQWDTSDGSIQESRFAGNPLQLKSPFGPSDKNLPGIRSIDYSDELDRVLVGTINCDISELALDGSSDMPLMDGHSGDIYHIAFHPVDPHVFATVSDSGHAHLWDSNTRQMTHCVPLGWDPRAVAFSPKPLSQPQAGRGGYHVAVGAQTGQIKILDEGQNLRPIHEMKDSKEGIADLKYSPNGKYLAAATYDTMIDVYSVERGYQRICRCHGHSATVRGVDWSIDSSVIMSNSNDFELLYWNAKTGKQMTMGIRDLDLTTYTSLLGFQVMGIWPPYADGLDINSLDRAKNRQWCVTSDDQGMVKLFAYPCVVHDAPHRAYRGHSSHVMSVRFNSNDSLVCTAGGHDWAVFQFRVVELKPEDPPPPAPEKVWGPIDETGRNYGWTTQPATLARPQGRPPPSPPASSPPPAALMPAPEEVYERPKRQVAPTPPPVQRRGHTEDEVAASGPSPSGLVGTVGGANDEDEFEDDFDHDHEDQPIDEGREFQQPAVAEEVWAAAPRAGTRAAAPKDFSPEYEGEVQDEF